MFLLRWRHNERDGVSNHQPHGFLLSRLFRHRSKKTLKLRVTGPCEGNSPVTGGSPAHRVSNAENASIWWRHLVPGDTFGVPSFIICSICSSQRKLMITSWYLKQRFWGMCAAYRGYPAKRALSAMRKHGGYVPFGRIPSILYLHMNRTSKFRSCECIRIYVGTGS